MKLLTKNGNKNSLFPALLFSAPGLPVSVKIYSFIVSNCLKLWHQIKKGCRLPDTAISLSQYIIIVTLLYQRTGTETKMKVSL